MSAQTHQSDPRVLNRRTLERDHSRLAELLRPGMHVLDVGCGTGSITAGIAKAIGPDGEVIGIDRDDSLLAIAGRAYRDVPKLAFIHLDIVAFEPAREFDIVTAARVLQWISDSGLALRNMVRCTKPSGLVVVLDYTHEDNSWDPAPPPEFGRFYRAFLDWRAANGWDNRMAEHLPEMFRKAGLKEVESHVSDEVAGRGADLWLNVIQSMGPVLVKAGYLGEESLAAAESGYRAYIETALNTQRLAMRTVVGRRVRSKYRHPL